jgi:hypothetical protein
MSIVIFQFHFDGYCIGITCIMTIWIDVNICKLQWVHKIVGKFLV